MGSKWKSYSFDDSREKVFAMQPDITSISKEPGCYVIFLNGQLGYIGQSKDVKNRMQNHGIDIGRYSSQIKTPWGYFKNILVKVKYSERCGDWAMWELRLLSKLNPLYNCVGNGKGGEND